MNLIKSPLAVKLYPKFPSIVQPLLEKVLNGGTYLRKKISNFLLNQIEIKMNRTKLLSYPYQVTIDPTNICNLNCPLCPTWQDINVRPKGKMDIQTFYKIFDEVGPYLFAVNLCNWGEPFLNPDLPQMIEYAKRFNTVVGLSTNLTYLPDKTAKMIMDSGIDIIVISLDGAAQKSYSMYRSGGNIETVFRNIEKLNSYRKNNTASPLLIWQFLVNKYNEHEIPFAKDMANKMGLQFQPSPMRTAMGKELLFPLYERIKEMQDWLPDNPAYSKYNYEIKPETRTKQAKCRWLWNSTVINWDGSVSPCCGVFEKQWDFQSCYNIDRSRPLSFHQVWNSRRYKLARRLVTSYLKSSKKLPTLLKESEKEGLICSNCIHFGFLED